LILNQLGIDWIEGSFEGSGGAFGGAATPPDSPGYGLNLTKGTSFWLKHLSQTHSA